MRVLRDKKQSKSVIWNYFRLGADEHGNVTDTCKLMCKLFTNSSYGDSREPQSRSPANAREGREPRDGCDARDATDLREPRSSRDDYQNHSSESRDKEVRGDPRDPAYSRDELDRHYRGGAEDYFRRKEEALRDFQEPRNGRRELEAPAEDLVRPEERRRNELYRQYYEELQRRQASDPPVDCSMIVVNKAQNREYAKTVGRKVRDLGMVVDLIFLNTEVSLTQALEDVCRSQTPFAIIITQKHQVHRSCTVKILYGTPQEHRNMLVQEAMKLIAHKFDTYKVESREKEREEIAKKAAKMADDVLLRDPDRESHPISALTPITLLFENRFVTPEELDILIAYLKDKRARLARPAADPLSDAAPPAAVGQPPPSRTLAAAAPSAQSSSSHQQELQAKVLSLFSSSTGSAAGGASSGSSGQMQGYGSMGPSSLAVPSQNPPRPAMPPSARGQGYGAPPSRMPPTAHRPPSISSGVNFNSPSVQKALDNLIQSGPFLNHLVGPGPSQQPPPRPGLGVMSMYPRPY